MNRVVVISGLAILAAIAVVLVTMTYYLRPDQVQAIDDLQHKSSRDKHELVRMALDIMID